ncbi:MAG: hypothetical protein R2865_10480 [Deinococcales bacterium]
MVRCLQRPFTGEITCEAGADYVAEVRERQEREAQTLARITDWNINDIRSKIPDFNPSVKVPNWWENVFKRFKN